jgi:hypothetical protein
MPLAAAVPAIISGAATVGTAVIGSRAAGKAAQTQSDAATKAAQMATDTANAGATDITNAGEGAATGVTTAAGNAAAGVTQAADQAATGIRLSADEANALLRSIYGDAITSLEPYKAAGTTALSQIRAGIAEGGEFNREFTAEDMEKYDPGYRFRLQEAQKALERSRSTGTLQSGGALKSLSRYQQGLASEEFNNAFNRFRANRADRYGILSNLTNIGQTATNTGIAAGQAYGSQAGRNIMDSGEFAGRMLYQGASDAGQFGLTGATAAGGFRTNAANNAANLRMRGTEIAGNAYTDAAASRAAGTMGSANAWAGTIPNLANIATSVWNNRRGGRGTGTGIYDVNGNYIGE